MAALTDHQLWAFDTQGFFVTPSLLDSADLASLRLDCTAAAGQEPQRLASLLCGSVMTSAARMQPDAAVRLNQPARLLDSVAEPTRLLGGGGERNVARAYYHLQGWDRWRGQSQQPRYLDPSSGFVGQDEVRVTTSQGLTVVLALSDTPEGAGGFVFCPCSHKSELPTPPRLAAGQADPLRVMRQAVLKPGEMLVMASSCLHGLVPWSLETYPQQLVLMEFISSSAPASRASPLAAEEQARLCGEMPAWVQQLDDVGRTLAWPVASSESSDDGSSSLVLSDGVNCHVSTVSEAHPDAISPSVLLSAPQSSPTAPVIMDHDEAFFFDLNGYLVLRGVMDADWISQSREALAQFLQPVPMEELVAEASTYGDPTQSEALRGLAAAKDQPQQWQLQLPTGLLELEDALPFRRMLSCPAVLSRLQWMLGAGFTLRSSGGVLQGHRGSHGQFLHSGVTNPTDEGHTFRAQNGRILLTETVNVEWVLGHDDPHGGFIVCPGSHKAQWPPPHEVRKCEERSTLVVPELQPGDVLLFLGASVLHGALPWTMVEEPRQVALFAFGHRELYDGPRL